MSSSIRSYSVDIDNGGDCYALELLDHKPEREVPEELFAESLAHPVATKGLWALFLPGKIEYYGFEQPVEYQESKEQANEYESWS